MSVNITIPSEYGYVILTVAGTFFLGLWHGFRVPAFRKPAEMRYPRYMADSYDMHLATPEKKQALYLFNCAQRAHGNYMESHPSIVIAMLIAGIPYPLITTALGVGWSVSRVIYAVGYTRKDKTNGSGRSMGSVLYLFQLGLYGLMIWSGVKMVM